MAVIWNHKTLSEALGQNIPHFTSAGSICYNTQDIKTGDIFIAFPDDALPTIKGTKDSHLYVKDAFANGATIAIVEHAIDGIDSGKLIIVPNSFEALQKMAAYKRAKSKATFICITGSAGKTSTKEATALALSQFAPTFANPGTFNNELGMPLTLASMPDDAGYVVLEIGMNHTGEISSLIGQINPDLVMINNILPVHLENFKSLDEIADAKLEIIDGLKTGGIAIFNADSEYYDYCCTKAIKKGAGKVLGFGTKDCHPREGGDPGNIKLDSRLRGNDNNCSQLIHYSFENNISNITASISGKEITFTTPISGKHRALNLVAVLTICHALGLDLKQATEAFADATPPKGRGQVHNITFNGHKCTVIDDAYNAGPVSTIASINHLKDMQHPYKILILGNMMELGPDEIKYHTSLLPHIIDAGVSKVYTIGNLMYELYKITPHNIQGKHFKDYKELETHLNEIVTTDMMILLKGSKSQKLWYIADLMVNNTTPQIK